MESKVLDAPFALRRLTEEGGFEGYGSVFDVEDAFRDVVARGAFERTLAEHRRKGRMPALLWQHDAREPIGVWREIAEDAVGLFVRGRLFVEDIARARQAHALLKGGGLSGLSIGFRAVESRIDDKTGVRVLTEVELFEVSLVTFPALEAARVRTVKAALERLERSALEALAALLEERARIWAGGEPPARRAGFPIPDPRTL